MEECEERNKRIETMTSRLTEFKDAFDKIILKLGFVKQQVSDLRNKNDELVL